MSQELVKKLDEYYTVFGDGFPTIPLARGRDDSECIDMINQCIKAKKDVYEMGFCSDSMDVIY